MTSKTFVKALCKLYHLQPCWDDDDDGWGSMGGRGGERGGSPQP